MSQPDNYLEAIMKSNERVSKKREERRAQWIKEFSPSKEILSYDDDGQAHTIGLWEGNDGSISFAEKRKNGYHPEELIHLDACVVKGIVSLCKREG